MASGGAVEDAAVASGGAVVTTQRKLALPRAQNKAPVWVVGQSVRSKETPQQHGIIIQIVSSQALHVSWSDTPTVTSYVKKNAVNLLVLHYTHHLHLSFIFFLFLVM